MRRPARQTWAQGPPSCTVREPAGRWQRQPIRSLGGSDDAQRTASAHLCPRHRRHCSRHPAAVTPTTPIPASRRAHRTRPCPRRAPRQGDVTAEGISPATGARPTRRPAPSPTCPGFDFAASASIVEVVVAKQKGYFDKMCLDVELKASFSTANYPLVAADEAQFARRGSYSEVVDYTAANDAALVAVAVDGQAPRSTASSSSRATAPRWHGSGGEDHRREGQDPAVGQGHAGPGRAGRGRRTTPTVLHRRLRPAGPHRARQGIVGFPGYKSQRAGAAGTGRRAVHPVRPVRRRTSRDRSA